MNRQLERQLRRLKLDVSTAPTVEQWAAFVERMETAYEDRTRERYLSDRASRLASSELAEATECAQQKSAELRTVIDALDEGVLLVDDDGTVQSANPASLAILGHDPVGLDAAEVFASLQPSASADAGPACSLVLERFSSALSQGHGLELAHVVLDRPTSVGTGPEELHLMVRVRPIPQRGITVIALNDITTVTEAEATRIGLERRIGHQHRLESIGRLAGSVAHDFNNVLAGILACVELLEDDVEGESLSDVAEIRRSARRGADLTRRLLAFSRHETDEPEVVEINAIVSDLSTLLERMLVDEAVFSVSLACGGCSVLIDPLDLEQIVMNLVVNSRDAVQDDGHISIETSRAEVDEQQARLLLVSEGDYVVVSVVDNGCGMDPTTVERAIEPFFTTKSQGTGNGLGLATVHRLVSNAGGALHIESSAGVGTTVQLYLPTADATGGGA